MNYFVEGLQGSGKSTLVEKLSAKYTGCRAIKEGDYSPVELAWCAYVNADKLSAIVDKYPDLKDEILNKSVKEDDKEVILYTKIRTGNTGFYKDMEQYEIYNGRVSYDGFKDIVLGRYRKWDSDNMIFECSLLQNAVEDMLLFRCFTDDEIISYYHLVRKALEGKDYRILYLRADDIEGNLNVIRKERSDDSGNELWFPLMMQYFNGCPYAKKMNVNGEAALIEHFKRRRDLEIRILNEVFPDKSVILPSKDYPDSAI